MININIDDYKMVKFHSDYAGYANGMGVRTIVVTNEKYSDEYSYGPSHPYKLKYGRSYVWFREDHMEEMLNDLDPDMFKIVEAVKA